MTTQIVQLLPFIIKKDMKLFSLKRIFNFLSILFLRMRACPFLSQRSALQFVKTLLQGGLAMNRKELEGKLAEAKSDYVRIQGDMDKLEYVRGRVSSAEEQLIRLEKEIADLNKQLDALGDES